MRYHFCLAASSIILVDCLINALFRLGVVKINKNIVDRLGVLQPRVKTAYVQLFVANRLDFLMIVEVGSSIQRKHILPPESPNCVSIHF